MTKLLEIIWTNKTERRCSKMPERRTVLESSDYANNYQKEPNTFASGRPVVLVTNLAAERPAVSEPVSATQQPHAEASSTSSS